MERIELLRMRLLGVVNRLDAIGPALIGDDDEYIAILSAEMLICEAWMHSLRLAIVDRLCDGKRDPKWFGPANTPR